MQKQVLAIHDLSCVGRCSLTVALPVLSAAGLHVSVLPTALLSTHTGEFTGYTNLDLTQEMAKIYAHFQTLPLRFDGLYSGFLGSWEQLALVEDVFAHYRRADTLLLVDPVMADGGRPYSGFAPSVIDKVRDLCRQASLILPNLTEARLLLGLDPALPDVISDGDALDLAGRLTGLAGRVVVTGLPMGKFVGCAGAGDEPFVVRHLHIDRSFPGTGDLFGAIVTGSLLRGNVLSAAADAAAGFVAQAIQQTPRTADTRFGVWFEPLLPRLAPMPEF